MYTSNSDSALTGFLAGRADNNNGYGNGMGWGMDGWWGLIIILALFGWGGNGFGGWGNGGNGAALQGALTRSDLCAEFNNNDLQNAVRGVQQGICDSTFALNNTVVNGFNGVARDMCTGFANVTAGINENRFAAQQCCCDTIRAIENSRFDTQTGFNALGSQLASCCCDIKSGQKDIQYQMATDTCDLKTTMLNNTRDIIDSQNANTRSILDWLCAKETADLRAENQSLKLSASQAAQNTFIQNAMNSQTDYLIGRIAPYPVPSFQVCPPYQYAGYGYNGYGYNNNCGCGCNSGCCGCNG